MLLLPCQPEGTKESYTAIQTQDLLILLQTHRDYLRSIYSPFIANAKTSAFVAKTITNLNTKIKLLEDRLKKHQQLINN